MKDTTAALPKETASLFNTTPEGRSTNNPLQLKAEHRAVPMQASQNPLQKVGGHVTQPRRNPLQLQLAKENKTGLPDHLKAGVEALSGYSMDDVKVHYNSSKPAQLQALAFAQGIHIHLAPGQEKHLPHEAWHVVQQKQGRVKATMQMKGGVAVNDDSGLEKEADALAEKSIHIGNHKLNTDTSNSKYAEIKPDVIQCKSVITHNTNLGKKDTPVTTLHKAFFKYFKNSGLPEVYYFHPFNVDYQTNPYNAQYLKASQVVASIDPVSSSKADSKNRNNKNIQPYGHFGVMERAIFGRPNIGNNYDGGHLVEHTLMEGQDADVEGNLAPQQNKDFNQGLMRGWEDIPEHYMHHVGIGFNYMVQVHYNQATYNRTGKQLRDAGVLGGIGVALAATDLPHLDAEVVTFERWVPIKWEAKIADQLGNALPPLTLTKGAHWNAVMPDVVSAQNLVIDASALKHPGLTRTYSGMLSGFIETAQLPVGIPNAVSVGNQTSFGAHMYQPIPQDVSDQLHHTANAGAYSGKTISVLPSYTMTVDSFDKAVDFPKMANKLHVHIQSVSAASKFKKKGKKPSAATLLTKMDAIGKKHSNAYNRIRNKYFRNAAQGGAFLMAMSDYREFVKRPLTKLDLVKIIHRTNKHASFGKKSRRLKLLKLPFEKKLK